MISKMWEFPTELKVGPRGEPGVHGEDGKDGSDGITPPGVTPRGKWSPKVAYEVGDLVRSNDGAWLAISNNRNRKPAAKGPWFLIVTDGKKGEPGVGGARGRRAPIGTSSIVSNQKFYDVAGPGMPVYVRPDFQIGLADAITNPGVIGLAASSSSYDTDGVIQRLDWSIIAGSASLVPNSPYYLGLSPGTLSVAPPEVTGQTIVRVGRAIAPDRLSIEISQPVIL